MQQQRNPVLNRRCLVLNRRCLVLFRHRHQICEILGRASTLLWRPGELVLHRGFMSGRVILLLHELRNLSTCVSWGG
jgi:hypothetical protein